MPARETGLFRGTVNLFYKEAAQRVDFDTIDKLCKLFQCSGDFFEYQEPSQSAATGRKAKNWGDIDNRAHPC